MFKTLRFIFIVPLLTFNLPGQSPAVQPNSAQASQSDTAMADPAQGAVWDLRVIFADDAAAELERTALVTELASLSEYQGHLGDSASALRKALDRRTALTQRVRLVHRYAFLKVLADARVTSSQAQFAASADLVGKFGAATAFYDPEIIALGKAKLAAFEVADAGLAPHRRELELLMRKADHVLGPEAEAAIAASYSLRQAPSDIHDIFNNAEMPWPTIPVHGKPTQLTRGVYRKLLSDPDPETRRTVFEAFTAALGQFKDTQAALLQAHVAGAAYEAKLRHYRSSADFLLAEDAMPEDSFDALSKAVEGEQSTIDRYLRLRGKTSGIVELHSYDLATPLTRDTRTYSLTEGEALVLKALAPLGPSYVDRLAVGFRSKRMHAIAGPGKAPGARTIPMGPNIPPFVLITYTGNSESLSILAHEWGHAMHMQLANAAQPAETADASVFLGDTPSLLNEMLLGDYMVEHAANRDEKIAALVDAVELLRGTYYRVLPFIKLELAERAAADEGEPLTADRITKLNCDLVKQFNGADRGVTVVDPGACLSWTISPEPYDDLYFYKYLIAVSAAAYFAKGIEQGDLAVRERYLSLLKAGGSDDPYVLLKRAGFDAREPSAYQAIGKRFEHYVEELEAELRSASRLDASNQSMKP